MGVVGEEPSLAEVQRALQQYPRVRDANTRINLNSVASSPVVSAPTNSKKSTSNTTQQANSPSLPTTTNADNFWNAFNQKMSRVSTNPIIGECIRQSLQEVTNEYIQSLSLDDIERIAKSMEEEQTS